MPKYRTGYVIVQVTVSIPRAGEFRVGVPIPEEHFVDPPTANELATAARDEVVDRLRVKLDKGELQRVQRHYRESNG